MKSDYNKIINYVKLIIFVVFIVSISIFIRTTKISSIDDVKRIVTGAGDAAPMIYILLFSFLPTFFIPVTILAMAAGFVFGFVKASVYTFIGAFINSTITYFVGKYVAHDLIEQAISKKYNDIYLKLKERTSGIDGFIFMTVLRVLPLIPFTFLNYLSGAVGYDYFIFITSTMIGIIPGLLAYVNMGASFDSVGSTKFYMAILIYVILVVITTVIAKIMYGDKLFKKESDGQRSK